MKRWVTFLLLLNIVLPAQAGVVIWDSGIVAQKIKEHRQDVKDNKRVLQPEMSGGVQGWFEALLHSISSSALLGQRSAR